MTFLNNITVVELSKQISASVCTKMMADLGATVIKIEPPGKGDPARQMGPFPNDDPHPEKSGIFLYLNTNKKSITIDITTAEGLKIFKELALTADLVVEDLGCGVMDQLGLGYATLEELSPRLVLTSITPFGHNGPCCKYSADEIVIEAISGMLLQHGSPDREPIRMGGNIIFYRAGASAFAASLAALLHAEISNQGQFVDISIQEILLHDDFITVEAYLAKGEDVRRRRAPMMLPASDGWFYIRAFPHEWPRLTEALGLPELTDDERFIDMKQRAQNAEELNAIVMEQLAGMTKQEIYNRLQEHRVSVAYLANVEDLFKSEQYKSRNYFVDIDHPVAGKLTYPGKCIDIEGVDFQNAPAPLLGEHNLKILNGQLGYEKGDIVRLRQLGVI